MDNNKQSEVNKVKEPSEKYNGNPQIEDGFTKISNELLEALSKAMAQGIITARERAVIDWIIRYTYGYQQKNGYFHTSFIAKNLGLSMSWISQILKSLEKKKIIIRNGDEIQINKHYLEWTTEVENSHRTTNLYVIQADNGLIKIGVSNNPEERLKEIQAGSPSPLKIVKVFKNVPSNSEHKIHKQLQQYKVYGEWFKAEALQYLEQSNLEQSKQDSLEPSKQKSLEHSKHQEPTNSIENEAQKVSKENIYKENNINKTRDLQNVSSSSLKDEKDLNDTPPIKLPPSQNEPAEPDDPELEKKIVQFYAVFEKIMETKYKVGYRVSYRPEAILLVQHYSLEDIEKALGLLKKKMQKEHPQNWRDFVKPTSLSKMIDDLLVEQEKQQKQEARNYGW